MFDWRFDWRKTKQATPAVGRKTWTRQKLWSHPRFWLVFRVIKAPAVEQLQALCCCGVWSRGSLRGGGGARPRPGGAGEARSAFGLWRLLTGGQRGHNLTTRRRRGGKREELEQLVMTSVWGLKPGTTYICNTLISKMVNLQTDLRQMLFLFKIFLGKWCPELLSVYSHKVALLHPTNWIFLGWSFLSLIGWERYWILVFFSFERKVNCIYLCFHILCWILVLIHWRLFLLDDQNFAVSLTAANNQKRSFYGFLEVTITSFCYDWVKEDNSSRHVKT